MFGKRLLFVLFIVVLAILLVQCVFSGSSSSEKPSISIKDGTEVTEDVEESDVQFVSKYSKEQGIVKSCDTYLNSLFCGSKTDMQVSSTIYDSVISKVSSVSPDGGFLARQLDIQHSGLSYFYDGLYKYIAIGKVYCIDMSSNSFSYDVIINMSVDENNVVTDFSLYSY